MGWLSNLEWRRTPGLLLDHRRPLAQHAARGDVADLELHQIATPQLGIDRTVEQREIPHAAGGPELAPDSPAVLRLERRFGPIIRPVFHGRRGRRKRSH
jgi:hypothetical protein